MWPCVVHNNFFTMAPCFSFLNEVLNGLKHETSKACKTREVCDGKVIIFKPNWWAYFIAYKITCDPSPSIINTCDGWLERSHQELTFWKKLKNFLNKNIIIEAFSRIVIHVTSLQSLMWSSYSFSPLNM